MKVTVLLLSICLNTILFSQISVTQTESPLDLVNNLLTGSNVIISNITYNGSSSNAQNPQTMIGHFNNNGSSFPITEGIVMATGDAILAVGPNTTGGSTNNNGVTIPDPSDPDLAAISTAIMYNECILEFDIIPTGDTLIFNYIFASEEYHEFSTSYYNDAFGFFISGPGISGPYTNGAENIAIIPGTTLPVTMNNLNNGSSNTGPCINCAFLIDNASGNDLQYDAHTSTLQASVSVQCGETYHIKLAIADAGDQAYDSAIFLEANSFDSNGSTTVINQTNIVESTCGNNDGSISINGLNTFNSYTYSIHNKDFSYVVTNQNTGDFTNIKSDLYSVIVTNNIGCKDSILIPLSDQTLTTSLQSSLNVSCYGSDDGTISATTIGGLAPYNYSLYNNYFFQQGPQLTCNFGGLNGTDFFIETIDADLCKHYLKTIITEPDSLHITNIIVTNNSCFESCDGSLEIETSGGTLPYSYSIDAGTTNQALSLYNNLCSGNKNILVSDANNCTSNTQIIDITQPSLVDINNVNVTNPSCPACCDGTLTITSTGTFEYSIDNGITFQPLNTFTDLCNGTYFIKAQSSNGCEDSTIIIVGDSPVTTVANINNIQCNGLSNGSINLTTTGGIPPYLYIWNSGQTTMNISSLDSGIYIITITDAMGTIEIDTFEVELDFNLDITLSQNQNILTANQSGAQYQWIDCTNNTSILNEINQTFTATQNGSYAVLITTNNCSDTSNCQAVTTIGIDENLNRNFKIYPNPSNGKVYLDMLNVSNPIEIIIMDVNGKVVTNAIVKSKTIKLDLAHLKNGIYFVKVKTNNTSITKKINLIK